MLQYRLANPVSDDRFIRLIRYALVWKLQCILLWPRTQSLPPAKLFPSEEGLFYIGYFLCEDKR